MYIYIFFFDTIIHFLLPICSSVRDGPVLSQLPTKCRYHSLATCWTKRVRAAPNGWPACKLQPRQTVGRFAWVCGYLSYGFLTSVGTHTECYKSIVLNRLDKQFAIIVFSSQSRLGKYWRVFENKLSLTKNFPYRLNSIISGRTRPHPTYDSYTFLDNSQGRTKINIVRVKQTMSNVMSIVVV